MKNKNISASDINKFVYCPYQWYYTRIYSKNELLQLCKERNEKLNLKDSGKSNLVKGQKFHNSYLFFYKVKKTVKFVLVIVLILLILLLLKIYER